MRAPNFARRGLEIRVGMNNIIIRGERHMKQKILIFVMAGILAFASFSGCRQMGVWTGQGAEEVEEGAESFEEGYKEGKD